MNDIKKEIQDWINAEERAGRSIDENHLNQYIQLLIRRHNNTPREEFNGLSPDEMFQTMHHPFSERCVVELNKLDKEHNAYETRVFSRLFYWLGLVEQRLNKQVGPPFQDEYKKTDLLSMIFSFKKV